MSFPCPEIGPVMASEPTGPSWVDLSGAFRAIVGFLQNRHTEDALRTWMKWLLMEMGLDQDSHARGFPSRDEYFKHLVEAFLQSRSFSNFKFCLAIFQRSVYMFSTEKWERELGPDSARDMSAYWNPGSDIKSYCHMFEIIVLGRYVNQVQECLSQLSYELRQNTSGNRALHQVPMVWWTILFKTAISSNNDQVANVVGPWLMENNIVRSEGSQFEQVNAAYVDACLTWAMSGTLALKTILRDGHHVRSQHGDRLTAWCERQQRAWPRFSGHALSWLRQHVNYLNQYITVYILAGIKNAEPDLEMFTAAARLATVENFSPLCRYLTRKYCLAIMERYIHTDSARDLNDGDIRMTAIDRLRVEINDSEDLDNGDMGVFLTPTGGSEMARHRAAAVLDKFVKEKFVVYHGDLFTIDWDLLHRYDPHQALWKRFAESWPHWVENIMSKGHEDKQSLLDIAADCVSNCFRLSRSKPYMWSVTTRTLRNLYFGMFPEILPHADVTQALLQFINKPPQPTPEHLLDVAIALSEGQRDSVHENTVADFQADESMGHAYVFDLLNRLRPEHAQWARQLMDSLLEPWRAQSLPIPVTSSWKHTSQLQAMIVLLPSCNGAESHNFERANSESAFPGYLGDFMHLLSHDPDPRNRFLLEWAVLYSCTSTNYIDGMLTYLFRSLEESVPAHPNPKELVSHIKLAMQFVLSRSADTREEIEHHAEEFSRLLVALTSLVNSPRVPVRFEAQASFPVVYEYARSSSLLKEMPCAAVFDQVYKFITQLDKYKEQPEARSLGKFDMKSDMNLATLFEGGYLYIPQEEAPLLYAFDLLETARDDNAMETVARVELKIPIGRINAQVSHLIMQKKARTRVALSKSAKSVETNGRPAPLQTKSLELDLRSLGLDDDPSDTTRSIIGTGPILIGSLLDAPVNIGGLSRAANVFGCHSLHIPSMSILQNHSFKSVSVDSELRLNMVETSSANLCARLIQLKAEGWSIVGLEQTSNSVVIGVPNDISSASTVAQEALPSGTGLKGSTQEIKKMPCKSVIVMGTESTGIPAEVLYLCDLCVEIKQWGVTRSLNVQTAAACVLFEWRREWGDGS